MSSYNEYRALLKSTRRRLIEKPTKYEKFWSRIETIAGILAFLSFVTGLPLSIFDSLTFKHINSLSQQAGLSRVRRIEIRQELTKPFSPRRPVWFVYLVKKPDSNDGMIESIILSLNLEIVGEQAFTRSSAA